MLSWKVYREDFNKRIIEEYDIFKGGHWEKVARELKKEFSNKKEWEEHFCIKLMSQYWARSEYEIVVTSWPPYIKIEDIDKINEEVNDREKTWGSKPLKVNINPTVNRKIDIYEQLRLNWDIFINYVWNNI